MLSYDSFLIGSRWAAAAGTTVLDVVSPIDESVTGRVPESTSGDVDAAVTAARASFDEGNWSSLGVVGRGAHLLRIMECLQSYYELKAVALPPGYEVEG